MLEVEFRRDVRPAEPAEEILNWSVQVPFDHQMTFNDLSEVMHELRLAKVPGDARIQVNGNQVLVWRRRQLL